MRWLHVLAHAQHPPPAQRVHDQPGAHVPAVGVHHVARAPGDRRGVEGGRSALRPQLPAQRAVVERRERPRQPPACRHARRVHQQRAERLPDRGLHANVAQPLGRRRARGRLALADLVPVEHDHARARGPQLARDGEPGERCTADQDVATRAGGERGALRAALGGSDWHGLARYSIWPFMEATMTPPDTDTDARVVEGSDGMLLEIDGRIVPNYDATIVPFEEGDVVTGKVVRIDKDEVLVDIGYKSEGVIPSGELSIRKSVDTSEEVEIGEEVDALVLTKEDQDGRLILSKKRARFERAWRRIEAAAESGEPVIGAVIEVVKGGLIIDLGVRGFLPASLVDIRRVPNLDEYLGQNIQTKVIELNRSRNNVVDFGAFVDLDGIDGLIHISELSWSHVNHPSEILSIGDTVQVKVLDIDRDRQRISLGLKQTQEDPWQRVVDTYNVGDELEGQVTKVVAFGAFVEILEGVEGLVHISELAQQHVENPREIVQPGDDVKVKILEIDSERRRLSLSIKRVEGQVLQRRPLADAGDLENVPELGLSEDVFAAQGEQLAEEEAPEAEVAEAPEAATEEPEAESQPGPEAEAESEPEDPEQS